MENDMRSLLPATLFVAAVLIPNSVFAGDTPFGPRVLPAPVGHFQPRAQGFVPGSASNQTEQSRLSTFDAEQKKLDDELDKKLDICRC
jgi:hypothetical protein